MSYLHWSKTRPIARYHLAASGVPMAGPATFDTTLPAITLTSKGPYGDPALLEALASRYGVDTCQVLPVPGTSMANFVSIAAGGETGHVVAMESPVYDPISLSSQFLTMTTIPLSRSPEAGFRVDEDELVQALAKGAKLVVVTNLHNPSGQYIDAKTITHMANRCSETGATLLVDEVYLDAVYIAGGPSWWSAVNLANNIVITNSLTKVYGLSGLRCGWIVGPSDILSRAREIVNLLHVDLPTPTSELALRALKQIPELEKRHLAYHEAGLPVYRQWANGERRIRSYPNFGALFECFQLPPGVTSDQLEARLVTKYETQVVPGRFFGIPDHVRVSTTPEPADLAEGLARISQALDDIVGG